MSACAPHCRLIFAAAVTIFHIALMLFYYQRFAAMMPLFDMPLRHDVISLAIILICADMPPHAPRCHAATLRAAMRALRLLFR